MTLAIPLELSQIAAAQRLHQRLEQWQLTDKAIAALGAQFPGFALHEVLLKATLINALYGTNVYAIVRMAEHVTGVMAKIDGLAAGPEFVELLAVFPQGEEKESRRHHSFASKFAHFFVDAERYPIMDSYATGMIKLHLGQSRFVSDPAHPYVAFSRNYEILKMEASFEGSNREMDHYLWLSGLYLEWRKDPKSKINIEVRALFENPPPTVTSDLDALMPSILSRAFKGEL